MRETAGIAAAPAARCRNRRRGSFVAFTLNGWPCNMAASTGRRCVRRPFDTIGRVPALLLRFALMLTSPSFVPLVALGESYTDFRCARKGAGGRLWPKAEAAVAARHGRLRGYCGLSLVLAARNRVPCPPASAIGASPAAPVAKLDGA